MIINLVKAHLKETLSYKKILLLYLSIFLFLIIRLYMFTNDLIILDKTANLLDWFLYSIGGPVGNTRLLNGFFFLILLFIIFTFCRSTYEKNPFIYYVLLTKSNSRLHWIVSIFISQLINTIVSVLITMKLTFVLGILFFETDVVSVYLGGSISLSLSNNFFAFLVMTCGIWGLNCLLSVQNLFTDFDLSNQAISAIIMILLLLIQVYFPILDNFNPIAYASLNSLILYQNHLALTIIFRLVIVLLINLSLFLLSINLGE